MKKSFALRTPTFTKRKDKSQKELQRMDRN